MNQRFCNGMVHVIKKGENLYQLSRMYRVPLALILRANPYVDVYNLQPGQEICIPVARPFPGMMVPPGGRPQGPREIQNGGEMREAPEMTESEPEAGEDRNEPVVEEQEDIDTFVSDGAKSLGEILKECGVSLSDFLDKNDLNQIVIAADVILYLPKKV